MSALTTDDLIKSIRVRGMFPDASKGSYSSENILMVASEELAIKVVPMILSAREKYYETFIDYPLVSGMPLYPIPERAVGGVISLAQYIINQSVANLTPLDPTSVLTTVTGLYPKGFFFEDDHIMVYPTPNASQGTIRLRYPQRTSRLAATIDCAKVTNVDAVTGVVSVYSIPSSWTASTVIDFIGGHAPCSPYGIDTAIYNVTGTDISFVPATIPLDQNGAVAVKVGDWIAPAGYTPLPGVMSEFFPVLAQCTVVKLLEAVGDAANLQSARDDLKVNVSNALKLITPRDQFGLKKVTSNWRQW